MPEGGGPLGLDAETLLMAGGFVLVFALVVVFMTFSFTPMLVYICVLGGVLPAAIALLFGAIEWHREKQLKEVAALLGRYRRVRMDDLAAKSGKTSVETERLLTRALMTLCAPATFSPFAPVPAESWRAPATPKPPWTWFAWLA